MQSAVFFRLTSTDFCRTKQDTFPSKTFVFLPVQMHKVYSYFSRNFLKEKNLERSGWGGNRTPDTRIFSPLLYRLSYPALPSGEGVVCAAARRWQV